MTVESKSQCLHVSPLEIREDDHKNNHVRSVELKEHYPIGTVIHFGLRHTCPDCGEKVFKVIKLRRKQ